MNSSRQSFPKIKTDGQGRSTLPKSFADLHTRKLIHKLSANMGRVKSHISFSKTLRALILTLYTLLVAYGSYVLATGRGR